MATQLTTDERLDRIDVQLERIATAVVTGFDRMDKALSTRADKADLNRVKLPFPRTLCLFSGERGGVSRWAHLES